MNYIENIKNDILNTLGLSIKNNYVYDDDQCDFLIYNNGMLKTSNMGIFHCNDNVFDPIFSVKQMQYLFNVYAKKEEMDNGLYVQSIGMNNRAITAPTSIMQYSLHVDTSEGSVDTNYYFNIALCYIEAIYRLSRVFENDPSVADRLRSTDFTTEQVLERIEKASAKRGKR